MVSVTPCYVTAGETAHGIHWTGGLVGPIAGLDAMEKTLLLLPGIENKLLSHPGHRQVTVPTEL